MKKKSHEKILLLGVDVLNVHLERWEDHGREQSKETQRNLKKFFLSLLKRPSPQDEETETTHDSYFSATYFRHFVEHLEKVDPHIRIVYIMDRLPKHKSFIPDEFREEDDGELLRWYKERLLLPDEDPRRIFVSRSFDDIGDFLLIDLFNSFDSAILSADKFQKDKDKVRFRRPYKELKLVKGFYGSENNSLIIRTVSTRHWGWSLTKLRHEAGQMDPDSTLRMDAVKSIQHRVFTVEEIKSALLVGYDTFGTSTPDQKSRTQTRDTVPVVPQFRAKETSRAHEILPEDGPIFIPTTITDDGATQWDPDELNLIRKNLVYTRVAAHDSRMMRDNSEQHVQLSGVPRFNHSRKMWELTWFPSSVVIELDLPAHQAIDELSGARALVEVRGRLSHETGDLFALTEFDGIAEGLEVLATSSPPRTTSVRFANWGEPVAAYLKKKRPKHQSPASRAEFFGPNSGDSDAGRHPPELPNSQKTKEGENAPNPTQREQMVEPRNNSTISKPYDQHREEPQPTRTTEDEDVLNSTQREQAVEPRNNSTISKPYDQHREEPQPTRTTSRVNTTGPTESKDGIDEGLVPMGPDAQTPGRPISLLLVGATVLALIAATLAALF